MKKETINARIILENIYLYRKDILLSHLNVRLRNNISYSYYNIYYLMQERIIISFKKSIIFVPCVNFALIGAKCCILFYR